MATNTLVIGLMAFLDEAPKVGDDHSRRSHSWPGVPRVHVTNEQTMIESMTPRLQVDFENR